MLAMIHSCALAGLEGYDLTVETDVGPGLSAFDIVGLPDASVRESKERVRAAIRNSGFDFPLRRITVNLSPADIRKFGPSLDLPIAIGILAATDQIPLAALTDAILLGELSLDGAVRPVSGVLPMADHLRQSVAARKLIVPAENAMEAAIPGGTVYGVATLRETALFLRGEAECQPCVVSPAALFGAERPADQPDMADVRGQAAVKRALEIAAAGGHNILLTGAPGSGKTMMARRLPGILPELSLSESIECTKIFSVAGLLPPGVSLLTERPFRAPHHSASGGSIIGGGVNPRPGEISLATHGVLFLDEFPEFSRDVLEALRQPLEEQQIAIARVASRVVYPADFQLVAAMNPCPCGYYGDPQKACTCSEHTRRQYRRRISGPLLDRIDLHVPVPRVEYRDISGQAAAGERSATIRDRVCAARERQAARLGAGRVNARMTHRELERDCRLDAAAEQLWAAAFTRLHLTGRSHDRLLRVARTIADLAGRATIGVTEIAEAIQYRSLEEEEV